MIYLLGGNDMLSVDRQDAIKQILLEKKSVTVSELAERFGVTFETIRRDFRALEKEGILKKTYGGAVLRQRMNHDVNFQVLSHIMVDVKRGMAAVAVDFVTPGDCIYLDFSTTCLCVAEQLGTVPVNVITNSLEAMNVLSRSKDVNLYSCGGCWDPHNCAFMGQSAVESLSHFHLDKAFISCRAVSMQSGISDSTQDEAQLRRQIIESSDEVYLIADHTKLDKNAFVNTCGFGSITAMITDQPLRSDWREFLDNAGIPYYSSAERTAEARV